MKKDFAYHLQRYVNGGCLFSADKFLYLFSPGIVFRKNASTIQFYFRQSENAMKKPAKSVQVKVEVYNGTNKFVKDLSRFLEYNLEDYLAGAYVHGSLGTNEEIGYSDFDGLVILKDNTLKDRKKLREAARLLNEARSIMVQMDPLQHHGWFVLTESDLLNYPESFFPSELFRYAKSLLSDRGLDLSLWIDAASQDYITPLKNLCMSIEKKLEGNMHPQNVYALKNLLSEFMLLPSLYVQARDRRGIFKKFSFEEAKKDFDPDVWRIMDEVSLMRRKWAADFPLWKRKLASSPRSFPFNLSRILSPPVSKELNGKLDQHFYQSMLDFTKTINRKIQ